MLATGPGEVNAASAERSARAHEIHRRLAVVYTDIEPAGRLAPVDELVCTILSQNTTDVARDRAYEALRAAYPTWEQVRDAPVEAVEDRIRVCGLANQKAPRIKRALEAVTAETGGELSLEFLREMPRDDARAWLTSIKGVGVKTASIVLLFALDIPALPVDTHVHRLARRLGLIPERMTAERAHAELESLLPEELYLPFHMELINHGRAVCRARAPRCGECPLTDLCEYYAGL
ncbi:MAG: endonuclease III domain-containing protein [Anaerolineae bacterium]